MTAALRLGVWVCLISAIAGGILYLRSLKARIERFDRPIASVESTRVLVERTLDADASRIDSIPRHTTYAKIRAMVRPAAIDAPQTRESFRNRRIAPLEFAVWTLRVRVLSCLLRQDGDLYLVIESGGIRGSVELPRPELCVGSTFHEQIAKLRTRLDKEVHAGPIPFNVGRTAEVTGVGFFGTASKHENGARLMPVLDLKWID